MLYNLSTYNFFYDLSFENFEHEDDNPAVVFKKQQRNLSRQHKRFAYKLAELKITLNLLSDVIEKSD